MLCTMDCQNRVHELLLHAKIEKSNDAANE